MFSISSVILFHYHWSPGTANVSAFLDQSGNVKKEKRMQEACETWGMDDCSLKKLKMGKSRVSLSISLGKVTRQSLRSSKGLGLLHIPAFNGGGGGNKVVKSLVSGDKWPGIKCWPSQWPWSAVSLSEKWWWYRSHQIGLLWEIYHLILQII